MSLLRSSILTRSSLNTSIRGGSNLYRLAVTCQGRTAGSWLIPAPSVPASTSRPLAPGGRRVVSLTRCTDYRTNCRGRQSGTLAGFRGARGCPFFLQQRLAAQANLSGRVDVDDLDQDLFAFLQLVAHVLHAVIGDLRDVQQPIGPRHDLDECAEVGDSLDLAEVGLVDLGRGRQLLD